MAEEIKTNKIETADKSKNQGPRQASGQGFRKVGRGFNLRGGSRLPKDEFESKLLDLARVTRVTGGGKRLRFRAVVVAVPLGVLVEPLRPFSRESNASAAQKESRYGQMKGYFKAGIHGGRIMNQRSKQSIRIGAATHRCARFIGSLDVSLASVR